MGVKAVQAEKRYRADYMDPAGLDGFELYEAENDIEAIKSLISLVESGCTVYAVFEISDSYDEVRQLYAEAIAKKYAQVAKPCTPKKPTMRDVAKMAYVSTTTVSKALSGKRQVSADTKARVQAAAKELGYVPDRRAQLLAAMRQANSPREEGDRMRYPATIIDVSKAAGVSVATVSRVINGKQHVSDSKRSKVMAAVRELGYMPNEAAQKMGSMRRRWEPLESVSPSEEDPQS
ncbi:MAG: LacI family DNA-binding transcriptional regulator [Eubacteriaceae bacterium]|nr:LacI family DNA-binding transcriptional regulator [Eubacteriaceae bacterium]